MDQAEQGEVYGAGNNLGRWARAPRAQARTIQVGMVSDEDMDAYWHASLALGPVEEPPWQPTPPPSIPSTASLESSTFEQELSDQEDQDLTSLLQVMPDLSSPGGMLVGEVKAQAHARGLPLPPQSAQLGMPQRPNTVPADGNGKLLMVSRPSTASHSQPAWTEVYRNTRKQRSLLRLARLNHQMVESVPEQSMLHAMLAAAQMGAETLDPYASLRCPIESYSTQSMTNMQGALAPGVHKGTGAGAGSTLYPAGQGNSNDQTKVLEGTGATQGQGIAGRVAGGMAAQSAAAGGAGHWQHEQHHRHHQPHQFTAAQHLESMLPWNRNPYLRGVCAKLQHSMPNAPSQFGCMQNIEELGAAWDDKSEVPASRLFQSIGHVHASKLWRQPNAKPNTAPSAPPRSRTNGQPEVEVPTIRPVTASPAVRTEIFHSTPFTFAAADPFALTNARMISDMLDKPLKKEDPKKKRTSVGRPASPKKRQGSGQAEPSSEEAEAAARKAQFLRKRNQVNDTVQSTESRASNASSKKMSFADVEGAKLEQRLRFVQAKQVAIASAHLNSSPLKVKASRPSSAMVASSMPLFPPRPSHNWCHPGPYSAVPVKTSSDGLTPAHSGAAAWTAPAAGMAPQQQQQPASSLQQHLQERQQQAPLMTPLPAQLSNASKNGATVSLPQQYSPVKPGDHESGAKSKTGNIPPGLLCTGTAKGAGSPTGWETQHGTPSSGSRKIGSHGTGLRTSLSGVAEWVGQGIADWGVLGASQEIRDALTEEVQEGMRAMNAVPMAASTPLAQTQARLQPGAPKDADVLTSFYSRPSSAAVAAAAMPRQWPGHGSRPGSALPVPGASSLERPTGCTSKGMKATIAYDMFLAEAFEDRKRGAFEHLGEVGRVLRRYQQQTELHTLQLSHCIRSIDQVGALADVLVQLPGLETLLLGGNDLDDTAFGLIGSQNVLNSPGAASITSLDLSDNRLGPASLKLLLPLLRHESMPEAPTLHTSRTPGGAVHSRRVRHSSNIAEALQSKESPSGGQGTPIEPQPGTPAQETSNKDDSGGAADTNASGIKEQTDLTPQDPGTFTSWRALKTSSAELEPPGPHATIAELARWWRIRGALKTSKKGFKDIPSTKLLGPAPIKGAQLSILDLSGNTGIQDVGIELLTTVMQGSAVGLQVLRIARCNLGERSACALGKALSNSNALKEVDLSWNRLGLGGARALAAGLRDTSQLAALKLAHAGLGDQGCAHIAQALQTNTSIKHLDLTANGLSADTCMVLFASLRINKTLDSLVLRDNPLGCVAARRLQQAVCSSSLTQLDLLGCSFYKAKLEATETPTYAEPSKPSLLPFKMSNVTLAYDPKEPEGAYTLDLSNPAHYQVALELHSLAANEGLLMLRGAMLDSKPMTFHSPDQLPAKGTFSVRALATKPTYYSDSPLSDEEFKARWLNLVTSESQLHLDPYRTAVACKALRKAYLPSTSTTLRGSSSNPSCPSTAPSCPFSASHRNPFTPFSTMQPAVQQQQCQQATFPDALGELHHRESTPTSSSSKAHWSYQGSQSLQVPRSEAQCIGRDKSTEKAGFRGDPPRRASGSLGGGGSRADGEADGVYSPAVESRPIRVRSPEVAEFRRKDNNKAMWPVTEDSEEPTSGVELEHKQDEKRTSRSRPGHMTCITSINPHSNEPQRPAQPSSNSSAAQQLPPPTPASTFSQSRPSSPTRAAHVHILMHVRAASDEWRMSLLEVMLQDAYLTCSQLCQVVECMHEPDMRLHAALLGFGVLSDPHMLHIVLDVLEPRQATAFREILGQLIMYHPANPTGAWSIRLGSAQDAMIARHLLVGFLQQHYNNLTKHPHNVCFTLMMINGKHLDLPPDPHKLTFPSSGSLELCFVDLRPVQAPPAPPAPPPLPSPEPEVPPKKPPQPTPAPTVPGLKLRSAALAAAAAYRASAAAAAAPPPAAPESPVPLPKKTEPVHKAPILCTEPVLMSKQQMDALIAALQHWPHLDPIKLVQLVDTSGHMEMHEAMQALGYPCMPSWGQAFVEHEIREGGGMFEEAQEGKDAMLAAAKLLAPGGMPDHPLQGQPPSRGGVPASNMPSARRCSSGGTHLASAQLPSQLLKDYFGGLGFAGRRASASPGNSPRPAASGAGKQGQESARLLKGRRQSSSRNKDHKKSQQKVDAKDEPEGQVRGSKAPSIIAPSLHTVPPEGGFPQQLQPMHSPDRRSSSSSSIQHSRPSSAASPPPLPSSSLPVPNLPPRPSSSSSFYPLLPTSTRTSSPGQHPMHQRLYEVSEGGRRRSSTESGFRTSMSEGQTAGLRDHAGFVEAMRMLAVSHYLTCDQLKALLALLPAVNERGVPSLGVELCTMFWARTVDRVGADVTTGGWTGVMQRLAPQQQVCLAQRLGYMNIFNRKRPAMHYSLRMFRADEHEIAWQLFTMAINSSHTCFLDFHVDGLPKKVNQGKGMWPVMRGSAATGTVPQTTCEFDFSWDTKAIEKQQG